MDEYPQQDLVLYCWHRARVGTLNAAVVDHAKYREFGDHVPDDGAPKTIARVIRSIWSKAHDDKWRSAAGQP
eukprot:2388800-Lingulodinium_polyedra.AAC.1